VNSTSPAATVLDEVATWAGVTTEPIPRGATAILFEGHELGHVHANRSTLDLPLSADVFGVGAHVALRGSRREFAAGAGDCVSSKAAT
jgi:Family of unknown function (DUF5519)